MRNLKRALSLALASVMLLGMMVVGSSAAFSDADEIVNKEAVEITAGLGLFAGSDGKFNPKGTVTRAHMAAVIAKMFYGSDLNADTYKGGTAFTDTAAFEGGWAEGYINLGVEKGWFKGYGDGTFGPGNAVTTAEAVTMLINLLGVDAGEGTWPMTVMATAEDIELFDMECELKPAPATNAEMTRDQLAVVVWNAMNYSAKGIKGYGVSGDEKGMVFATFTDAYTYAGEDASLVYEVKESTLALDVFGVNKVTGFITANQATGADCTVVGGEELNLETGLDMLGHYVTAYFDKDDQWVNENKPGTAYAIVDEAEYYEVEEAIKKGDKKAFNNIFPSKFEIETKVRYTEGNDKYYYPVAMDFDSKFTFDNGTKNDKGAVLSYNADYATAAGTYVVNKETGKIIAFIAPVDFTVGTVSRVVTTAGKEAINLKDGTSFDNTEDEDEVVEYDGIAKDDVIVIKTYADANNEMNYLEKVEIINGVATRVNAKVDDKDVTYFGDEYYFVSENDFTSNIKVASGTVKANADPAKMDTVYDAYVYGDQLLGVVAVSGAAALNDAIYVTGTYAKDIDNGYKTVKHYYAHGFDAAGKEVSILVGIDGVTEKIAADKYYTDLAGKTGFYTFEEVKSSDDKEMAKKDIMAPKPAEDKTAYDKDPEAYDFFALGDKEIYAEKKLLTNKTDRLYLGDKDAQDVKNDGRVYVDADTKFVVLTEPKTNKDGYIPGELEIATYTGSVSKDISGDTLAVAAAQDADKNYIAKVVVITTKQSALNAEDFIYVIENLGSTKGGVEYKVFFTKTNEFGTIVSADDKLAGLYDFYTIDEDGLYDLEVKPGTEIKNEIYLASVLGTKVTAKADKDDSLALDLYNAADAVVVDLRSDKALENSQWATRFESLEDVMDAHKSGEFRVHFNAVLDESKPEEPAVTHIFVTSIDNATYDKDGKVNGWEADYTPAP